MGRSSRLMWLSNLLQVHTCNEAFWCKTSSSELSLLNTLKISGLFQSDACIWYLKYKYPNAPSGRCESSCPLFLNTWIVPTRDFVASCTYWLLAWKSITHRHGLKFAYMAISSVDAFSLKQAKSAMSYSALASGHMMLTEVGPQSSSAGNWGSCVCATRVVSALCVSHGKNELSQMVVYIHSWWKHRYELSKISELMDTFGCLYKKYGYWALWAIFSKHMYERLHRIEWVIHIWSYGLSTALLLTNIHWCWLIEKILWILICW